MRFGQISSVVGALALVASGWAQTADPRDLTAVSLEDLMNIQVTSVSKKEQSLSRTGAAVFVITRSDIRRSGMRNIPDLLRMAPGVEVARIDANAWAISIRGFNYRYSTKVLVLVDGRTVYNPAFSGVYWDQQDVPLEDIERIEVIRGPGGTVWGANAVNGVINIITRSSQDTQGGLITAGTGSEESASGLVQYGGKAGKKGTYRVFGRYFKVENSTAAGGGHAADGWHGSHAGMRSDWTLSRRDTADGASRPVRRFRRPDRHHAVLEPATRFSDLQRQGEGGEREHLGTLGAQIFQRFGNHRARLFRPGPALRSGTQRPEHRRRRFSIPFPGRLAARYRRGRRLPPDRSGIPPRIRNRFRKRPPAGQPGEYLHSGRSETHAFCFAHLGFQGGTQRLHRNRIRTQRPACVESERPANRLGVRRPGDPAAFLARRRGPA